MQKSKKKTHLSRGESICPISFLPFLYANVPFLYASVSVLSSLSFSRLCAIVFILLWTLWMKRRVWVGFYGRRLVGGLFCEPFFIDLHVEAHVCLHISYLHNSFTWIYTHFLMGFYMRLCMSVYMRFLFSTCHNYIFLCMIMWLFQGCKGREGNRKRKVE